MIGGGEGVAYLVRPDDVISGQPLIENKEISIYRLLLLLKNEQAVLPDFQNQIPPQRLSK